MTKPFAHTPSPWVIIPAQPYDGDDKAFEGGFTSFAGIEGDDGNAVCVFGSAEGSGCMFGNEADYHLIASAPDLLSALECLSDAAQHEAGCIPNEVFWDALKDARAAIAKAKGVLS